MVRPDDIDDYHYGTGDMDVQSIHENAMHEVRMRGVSNNRIQARRELFETMLFSELSEDQRKKMQEEPFNKYKSIKVSFSLHALSHFFEKKNSQRIRISSNTCNNSLQGQDRTLNQNR